MKAFWIQQARRINALTLRERVIMFASLAVALGALADALVLSPQISAQKAMATQLRAQNAELDGLRAQLASLRGPGAADTPLARLQRSLAAARTERAQVDAEITRRSSAEGGAALLPELLERVLKRHERLTLLRLATVKPAPAASGDAPRQAVQLAVRGSYPDLTQYLAETEAALPGLRWGDVAIARQGSSAELTATVLLHRSPT